MKMLAMMMMMIMMMITIESNFLFEFLEIMKKRRKNKINRILRLKLN
jgi:hypothetical protein